MNVGPEPPQHNADLMEVEDYDKPLIVFDDDDDVAALRDVGRGKECGTAGAGKSGRTSGANHLHLLDDNNELVDAIRLSDDSASENASTSADRQGGKASKDTEPFEFVGDELVAPPSSGSSSSPRRLRDQMNASPEPDLRGGGVGRTARRARGPRSCKTNPDVAPASAAYGGISERTRKKVAGRDEN